MEKSIVTTTIIGVNRLTASLGMALRAYSNQANSKLHFKIIGQDGDHAALKTAREMGALDETQNNAREAVRRADVVIVCLPLGIHADIMEYFGHHLKIGAVVLDMSINKAAVVDLAEKYFPRNDSGKLQAYLVGIQPLVATPHLFDASQAVADANPQLFAQSEMIIAPDAACPEEAVKLATDLAEILTMQPRFMTPAEYDGLANFTEQLPLLLAVALFGALQGSSGRLDLERSINPNFALMVGQLRYLAGGDLVKAVASQAQDSLRRVDDLIGILTKLRELLANPDQAQTEAFLKDLLVRFALWEGRRTKRNWDELIDQIEVAPAGLFGGLFTFKKPSPK